MKILHIFKKSVFTDTFINFFHQHADDFSVERNKFVILNQKPSDKFDYIKEELRPTLAVTIFDVIREVEKLGKDDKIILHGFLVPKFLIYLILRPSVIKKCTWSIWGEEVYFRSISAYTFKNFVIESLRKRVIPKISRVTGMVKGDFEYAMKKYSGIGVYLPSFYLNATRYSDLPEFSYTEPVKPYRVLAGNSADPSNNHIEIFEFFQKFAGKDLKVVVPLSYGDMEYAAGVIEAGKRMLGESFEPITDFMPADEYGKLLAGCDCAVMNHKRQQGLGNIWAMLAMGKKIYLRGDITSYSFFRGKDILVFDFLNASNITLDEFFAFSAEQALECSEKIRDVLSDERALEYWREVLYENN